MKSYHTNPPSARTNSTGLSFTGKALTDLHISADVARVLRALARLPSNRVGIALRALARHADGVQLPADLEEQAHMLGVSSTKLDRYRDEYQHAVNLAAELLSAPAEKNLDGVPAATYTRVHDAPAPKAFKAVPVLPSLKPDEIKSEPTPPVDNSRPAKKRANPGWPIIQATSGAIWTRDDKRVACELTGWLKSLDGYAKKAGVESGRLWRVVGEQVAAMGLRTTARMVEVRQDLEARVKGALQGRERGAVVPPVTHGQGGSVAGRAGGRGAGENEGRRAAVVTGSAEARGLLADVLAIAKAAPRRLGTT
jgi:hypothetical protein